MTTGTIVRTIVLFLAIANQVLSIFGKSIIPIEEEQVNILITTSWTVISALVAWWKNNSFTKNAQVADDVKNSPELTNGRGE